MPASPPSAPTTAPGLDELQARRRSLALDAELGKRGAATELKKVEEEIAERAREQERDRVPPRADPPAAEPGEGSRPVAARDHHAAVFEGLQVRRTGCHAEGSGPRQGKPLIVDLRVGRFSREFLRGTLSSEVDYAFGGLTGKRLHFRGEEIARAQDAAPAPIAGLRTPEMSASSPWGVPAPLAAAPRRRR